MSHLILSDPWIPLIQGAQVYFVFRFNSKVTLEIPSDLRVVLLWYTSVKSLSCFHSKWPRWLSYFGIDLDHIITTSLSNFPLERLFNQAFGYTTKVAKECWGTQELQFYSGLYTLFVIGRLLIKLMN